MKKILVALVLLMTISSTSTFARTISAPVNPVDPKLVDASGLAEILKRPMSVEEFLTLTPKSVFEETGTRLSFKETLALKKAQKNIKKTMENQPNGGTKKQMVAFLLCLFFGYLGVHRFYTGHIGIGIIQLLTGGGCGLWAFIDFIRIIMGDMKAKDGSDLESW
jgi:hypothetical protein